MRPQPTAPDSSASPLQADRAHPGAGAAADGLREHTAHAAPDTHTPATLPRELGGDLPATASSCHLPTSLPPSLPPRDAA